MRAQALGVERHALAEQPLVALDRQVGDEHVGAGADARLDLGDVGVDVLAPERAGDRDAVVAVAHEVQLADPEDRDGRERLAAPLRLGDPLPAGAQPRAAWGGRRGRSPCVRSTVPTIESSAIVCSPRSCSATRPSASIDLLEREDVADVVGLEAQPPREVGQHPRAPRPGEVALCVLGWEAGAHRCRPGWGRARSPRRRRRRRARRRATGRG